MRDPVTAVGYSRRWRKCLGAICCCAAIAMGCSDTDGEGTGSSELADAGVDGSVVPQLRNGADFDSQGRAVIEHALQDPWVSNVEGAVSASVGSARDGRVPVTLLYDQAQNSREFTFPRDGCGIQPDIVTGVRFWIEVSETEQRYRTATKSFTWEDEDGRTLSCVADPT